MIFAKIFKSILWSLTYIVIKVKFVYCTKIPNALSIYSTQNEETNKKIRNSVRVHCLFYRCKPLKNVVFAIITTSDSYNLMVLTLNQTTIECYKSLYFDYLRHGSKIKMRVLRFTPLKQILLLKKTYYTSKFKYAQFLIPTTIKRSKQTTKFLKALVKFTLKN